MNRLETEVPLSFARRVVLLTVLVLAFAFALGPKAHAAGDLTPAQKLEMKQLYERATRAYDVGKYNEAIEEYQKAYEIGGDPPMLYNIAQAYRLNDQPGEALRFYRRYLQRAPGARNRDDVERKIADLEKQVEEKRKAAAAATPPPAAAPPLVPVPATPPPAPAPAVGPPAPAPAVTPTTTPETPPAPAPQGQGDEGSGHTLRVVGWSLLGAGVLSGAGALVAGLLARGKGNDLTNMSAAGGTFDPNIEHDGKLYNNLMWGFGIAGGALAVTGAILVIAGGGSSSPEAAPAQETPPPPPAPSAMVTPWLGNGLVGAGAGFRF